MEIFKRKIKKWLILSAIFVLAIIILVVFIKWSFTPSIRNTEIYTLYLTEFLVFAIILCGKIQMNKNIEFRSILWQI